MLNPNDLQGLRLHLPPSAWPAIVPCTWGSTEWCCHGPDRGVPSPNFAHAQIFYLLLVTVGFLWGWGMFAEHLHILHCLVVDLTIHQSTLSVWHSRILEARSRGWSSANHGHQVLCPAPRRTYHMVCRPKTIKRIPYSRGQNTWKRHFTHQHCHQFDDNTQLLNSCICIYIIICIYGDCFGWLHM